MALQGQKLRNKWRGFEKKYGHVATCLNFDFCPHHPTYMALQGQKLRNSWPKESLKSTWRTMGSFFWGKKGERLPQLCVCDMDIEASSLPLIAIHTKLWQLLSCSGTNPWSVKQLWVAFLIFLRGLMRVIKKSEVRKIIIGHVELTLIFLFDYLLCKIAILESLKVLFLDKKQKLLSVDGIWCFGWFGYYLVNFEIKSKFWIFL